MGAAVDVCTKCGGSGWVVEEREGIRAARRCGCLAAQRAGRNADAAQIPPKYAAASLENFSTRPENPYAMPQMQNAVIAVRAYTRDFPMAPKPGLMLIGNTGTGKTHLAVAALKLLLAKGHQGIFFDYQNLLERIRSSYDSTSGQSDREAYRVALDAEVLLLDDLGAHRVTDWVEDTVTSIITWRCNHQKATIVTTNYPDPDAGSEVVTRASGVGAAPQTRVTLAERVGMRARSRLFEMCRVIKMPDVEDYRVYRSRSGAA